MYESLNGLTSTSSNNWTASYGYDGFGNLLTIGPSGAAPSSMTLTVNYDANGNVLAKPDGFSGNL